MMGHRGRCSNVLRYPFIRSRAPPSPEWGDESGYCAGTKLKAALPWDWQSGLKCIVLDALDQRMAKRSPNGVSSSKLPVPIRSLSPESSGSS